MIPGSFFRGKMAEEINFMSSLFWAAIRCLRNNSCRYFLKILRVECFRELMLRNNNVSFFFPK